MPSLRLWLVLSVFIASAWIYLFNLRFIAAIIGKFIINADVADAELWRHVGLDGQSKMAIKRDPRGVGLDDLQAYRSNLLIRRLHGFGDLQVRAINLDINTSDVLAFIHIQKTGGTYLEDNLVLNTDIQPPVLCKSMPGAKDSYHYITMIRDPVTRFMSEWLHVRRGATWKESRLFCGGKDATLEEVPFCFKRGSWRNVSFDEFVNCSSNMALNRQTRMLANLSLSDCYRLQSNLTRKERDEIMLQSAKDNLARLVAFFGILENMEESQKLFEKTFVGLQFTKTLFRKKSYSANYAVVSESHWIRAVENNHLDVRLYQYAKDLFLQRLEMVNITTEGRPGDAVIVAESFKYIIVPST